jgi:hypothetical protein
MEKREKDSIHAIVTDLPYGLREYPWGLFRKPCEGRVQDNLRKWKTGGLRWVSSERPFEDVIRSAPTRGEERAITPHPSLKPQVFMRQVVRASLPLGVGTVLDPFMGGGSTIAAALAVGYESIGIESDPFFYRMAERAIAKLAELGGEAMPSRTVAGPLGGRPRNKEIPLPSDGDGEASGTPQKEESSAGDECS